VLNATPDGEKQMDVKEAVERITLLQELTEATGTRTTRVQGRILQELSDDDLVTVASELKHRGILRAILSGKKVVGVQ
jgi:hypothetical protein